MNPACSDTVPTDFTFFPSIASTETESSAQWRPAPISRRGWSPCRKPACRPRRCRSVRAGTRRPRLAAMPNVYRCRFSLQTNRWRPGETSRFSADPANIVNQVDYVTAGAYKKTFRSRRKEVRRVKVTETVGTIYTCRQGHRYLPCTELD